MIFGMSNSVQYSPEFKNNLKPLSKKYSTLKKLLETLKKTLLKILI